MTDRIRCCVPFCRRTRRPEPECMMVVGVGPVDMASEWICGPHWREVPARLKRVKAAARRALKKAPTARHLAIEDRVWRWCKEAAVKAAAGL